MTLMSLDHDSLPVNTKSRLVAELTKSILLLLILNPGITNEILVLEIIIHLDFEG